MKTRIILYGVLLIGIALMAVGVYGILYTVVSNTVHPTWTLNCSVNGPVCVFFNATGGNSTVVNFNLTVRSTQTVTMEYLNVTLASSPPNVVFTVNGTGLPALFGPYSLTRNINYPFNFQVNYNGTYGVYDFAVNVVHAG